jgi:hypothetical protein
MATTTGMKAAKFARVWRGRTRRDRADGYVETDPPNVRFTKWTFAVHWRMPPRARSRPELRDSRVNLNEL